MSAPATITPCQFQGQPAIALSTAEGARALVSLFGGQVLSWTPAGGEERLYLSEQARFDAHTPLRGGVPVCFPQFAAQGRLPRHGLLRTAQWQVREQRADAHFALLTLGTRETDASHAVWPHCFDAELTLVIEGPRLDVELEIRNTSHAPFAFNAALHTYLRVREVEHCRLHGLSGLQYRNQPDNRLSHDSAEALVVDDRVDRVYHNVPGPLLLQDSGRNLQISQQGFPDVVVWNPWEHDCAQLADMPARGFRNMLCVEAAAVRSKIQLDADDSWVGRQSLLAL